MKYFHHDFFISEAVSLPMRERGLKFKVYGIKSSCSAVAPHAGAWIEIETIELIAGPDYRRSPCGGRGLKLEMRRAILATLLSLPMRGAWIEIP